MHYDPRTVAFEQTGSGPGVILIHGNPATHTLWSPVVARVSDVRTVYAIDLPGFGRSPMPSDRKEFAMDRLAETVLGFAETVGLDRFDLVGHSFGGGIALTLAAMAPTRIRTLAAITPLTTEVPLLGRLARSRAIGGIARGAWRILGKRGRRWGARNWARVSYGKGYTPERAAQIAVEAERPDLFSPLTGLMRAMDPTAYTARLNALATTTSIPLLLVGAGEDRVIPHEQFLRLASRLPNARIVDIDDCGHVPMWQYPDRLADLLRELWNRWTER